VKNTVLAMLLGLSFSFSAALAQSAPASMGHDMNMSHNHEMDMSHGHDHGASVPVSYSDLTKTAAMLEKARRATEKYQDVRVAEADGYQAIGPDVPGMGIHYIGSKSGARFNLEQPPILLYEKNPSVAGGYQLVGVSYLFSAAEGPDGQPQDPPFPKALAQWHRHENLCVLADRSVRAHLNESECVAQGGHFTAESQWMLHAWIWKDSPTGVFAPTNPSVQ
jgi:hypothetical protein